MPELQCQFYSSEKLVDRHFSLSGDPYDYAETDLNAKPLKELQEMGVFFWRDQVHVHGIILNPDLAFPVNCFYSQLILDGNTMTVSEWGSINTERVKSIGDNLSWIFFNKPRVVIGLSATEVRWQG